MISQVLSRKAIYEQRCRVWLPKSIWYIKKESICRVYTPKSITLKKLWLGHQKWYGTGGCWLKRQQHKLESHENWVDGTVVLHGPLYALLTERKLLLYAAALIIMQEDDMWPGDAHRSWPTPRQAPYAMFYDAVPSVDPRLPKWFMFADLSAKVSDHHRMVEITLEKVKDLLCNAGIIWYGTNDPLYCYVWCSMLRL